MGYKLCLYASKQTLLQLCAASAYLTLLSSQAGEIMTESAQKAAVALATQEIKANPSLLAVDANNQSHIMGELATAASGTHAFGEVKADLCLWIIAGRLEPCTAYLIFC